jgi:hypothetical protein
MKAFHVLGLAAGVLGVNAMVSAAPILEQNFDNTTTFPASSVAPWGTAGTAGGRWVSTNAAGMQPTVITGGAQSGTQSIQVVRGSDGSHTANLGGQNTSASLSTNFEMTSWIYRNTDGGGIVSANNNTKINTVGTWVYFQDSSSSNPGGVDTAKLLAYDTNRAGGAGYAATSITTIPVNSWFGVKIVVPDISSNQYNVLYNDGTNGWVAAATGLSFTSGSVADVNSVQFGAQSGSFLVDSVSLSAVPEPGALGLLTVIGMGMLGRRGRRKETSN